MATLSRHTRKRLRDAGLDEEDPFARLLLKEIEEKTDIFDWERTPLPTDGGEASIAEVFQHLHVWLDYMVTGKTTQLDVLTTAIAPRHYVTQAKQNFSSGLAYGDNALVSLIVRTFKEPRPMLVTRFEWDDMGSWPLASMLAFDAPHRRWSFSLDLIRLNAALQGRGLGPRILNEIERAMCRAKRIDVLLAHFIHRPFFYLTANRHGWTLCRIPRRLWDNESGEWVPNTKAHVLFGDDTPNLSHYTFSPAIGVDVSIDNYFPHAFWATPASRVVDVATYRERRSLAEDVYKQLYKIQRLYARANATTYAPGVISLRFDRETHTGIARHVVALGNTDEGGPLVCTIKFLSPLEHNRIGWLVALLVLLGRTYWRALVVELPQHAEYTPATVSHAWTVALQPWALRHLGERPDFEPAHNGKAWRWIPVKRQWYQRGGVYTPTMDEGPMSTPPPPPKENAEPDKKRTRLRCCLHCHTEAMQQEVEPLYFCHTDCQRAYYDAES